MYHHLLLPIEANDDSRKAVRHGLKLAGFLRARVTILTARQPVQILAVAPDVVVASPADHVDAAKADARALLEEAAAAAREAAVAFETIDLEHESLSAAILETAIGESCDLIVLHSAGRRGLTALLLGDDTTDVLDAATIPVLLVR